MKSIYVTVLCGRNLIHTNGAYGLMSAQAYFIKNNIHAEVNLMVNSAPVHYIRSQAANQFMHNTTAEYLLFIDDDIGFMAKDVEALINVKEDLVVGGCPFRRNTPGLVLELKYVNDKLVENKNGAIELHFGGTGFMLIHRRVFEKMALVYPELRYNIHYKPELAGKESYNYFDTMLDEKRQPVGEDVAFCRRYTAMGGKIWMAKGTNLTHSGMHTFTCDLPKFLEEAANKFQTTSP